MTTTARDQQKINEEFRAFAASYRHSDAQKEADRAQAELTPVALAALKADPMRRDPHTGRRPLPALPEGPTQGFYTVAVCLCREEHYGTRGNPWVHEHQTPCGVTVDITPGMAMTLTLAKLLAAEMSAQIGQLKLNEAYPGVERTIDTSGVYRAVIFDGYATPRVLI